MKNLIEILPNVYGVKVPIDAKIFYEKENQENFLGDLKIGLSEELSLNWRILGFLTKDEISFDASDVIDSTEIDIEQYDGILIATPIFWDYELESFSLSSSDESFRSAFPDEIKENEKYLILERL